jgi:hypothetical protein
METEFLVESLGSEWLGLVNIDNLPLLVSSLLISINDNSLSFFILSTIN